MFRRRNEINKPHEIVREWLWPRMGWRRMAMYVGHRVSRMPDSAVSLAAGFACGAAISFTPFIGFHFVLAALLAWILNANVLASAFGTVVGNPWTFPFIWWWTYKLGSWFVGNVGAELPEDPSLGYIFSHPAQVLVPMSIGGFISGFVAWVVVFVPVYRMIASYQNMRRWRRTRRKRKIPTAAMAAQAAKSTARQE